MTRGRVKSERIYEGNRASPSISVGLLDFLYKESATKDSRYNIGDHIELPDGREFVYSKSSAACISGQGCEFTAVGVNAYQAALVARGVGERDVTLPACTHDAFTLDELRGGYVLIYDGTTNNVQFRGIIGNDVTAVNVAFKVYLDGALTEAVVASTSAIEAFQNPYSGLRTGTSMNLPKAGVPAAKVTAANMYFWCQIKKFCWVAPQGGVNDRDIGCYWRHDGSLQDTELALGAITLNAACSSQYAGHTVEGNQGGIGPLFNLQN